MTIRYALELVVKAQSEEGITPPLLPPIQINDADDLLGLLILAKYTAIGMSADLDNLDDRELSALALKVERDVVDGKYKWIPVKE
jgi:hypothetical protein